MAKLVKSFPLSSMTGGINRHEDEARKNQTVDAEDVLAEEGVLRRRDAFSSFAMSAPYFLPAGKVYVKYYQYSGGGSWGDYATRTIGSASRQSFGTNSSGKLRLFIGCTEEFQGFHWGQYFSGPNGDSVQSFIRIRFVTSNWVDSTNPASDVGLYETAKWVGDTTKHADQDILDNASKPQPFSRDGHVWWHKNSQPSDWGAYTVDGVSAYWIIVDMATWPIQPDALSKQDYISEWPSTSVNFQLLPPGIRCFLLHPVTGLFTFGNTLDSTIVTASHSGYPRGQETGGVQLGSVRENKPTDRIGILKDEGSGWEGTYVNNGWATNPGTSSRHVEKSNVNYDWQVRTLDGASTVVTMGSWGFPLLHTGISPIASPTPTTTSFSFTLSGIAPNEFEDCIALCSSNGSGSITEGQSVRISSCTVSGSTVSLTFSNAWSALPTTDSVFRIFGIPHYCKLTFFESDKNRDWTGYGNMSPAEYDVVLTSDTNTVRLDHQTNGAFIGDRYDPDFYYYADGPVYFQILKESRYELTENQYLDYTYDPITQQFIFAMGSYPLQTFDGYVMRKLEAISRANDVKVQAWTGAVEDASVGNTTETSVLPATTVRKEPPRGKFIRSFYSRLFVAGIDGAENTVMYSAPGADNNVWLKAWETTLRDPNGSRISGMEVLGDELVVYTPTSIFSTPPPDESGYMNLTSRSFGVGFINHLVVKKAVIRGTSVLLGANADGIYAYTGAEPFIVLDEWDRVVKGGVNKSRMNRACAEVSYYENCYYLAVPSSSASYPDKLIRYDWEAKTMYVWNAPFGGITSIAVQRDDVGNEEIIFGHADGTLSTLSNNTTDDGEYIDAYATTAVFSTGGITTAVKGYMVTVDEGGLWYDGNASAYEEMDFTEYVNRSKSGTALLSSTIAAHPFVLVNSYFLNGTSVLSEGRSSTRKINSKSGTRAESLQLKVSGRGRWKLRSIEVLLQSLSQRSRNG